MSTMSTAYFWFRDQGSIVAGVLAAVAGAAAYVAGVRQATATRKAAAAQIAADDLAAEDASRSERRNLAYLLNAEALRIKMEAELRLELLRKGDDPNVGAAMRASFKIAPREILVAGRNMANLLQPDTCDALIALLTSVDLMNAQLEIRTQFRGYSTEEFNGALITVVKCADRASLRLIAEIRGR